MRSWWANTWRWASVRQGWLLAGAVIVAALVAAWVLRPTPSPAPTRVEAWQPATAAPPEDLSAQLLAKPGVDPVRPLASSTPTAVGRLAGPDFVFFELTAEPGSAAEAQPRNCMIATAGASVVDHFCQYDGEYPPQLSRLGYLALPVTDSDVTDVRLWTCGHRYIESPRNGFVVFPLAADESTAGYAARMFDGAIAVPGTIGDAKAVTATHCVPPT